MLVESGQLGAEGLQLPGLAFDLAGVLVHPRQGQRQASGLVAVHHPIGVDPRDGGAVIELGLITDAVQLFAGDQARADQQRRVQRQRAAHGVEPTPAGLGQRDDADARPQLGDARHGVADLRPLGLDRRAKRPAADDHALDPVQIVLRRDPAVGGQAHHRHRQLPQALAEPVREHQ